MARRYRCAPATALSGSRDSVRRSGCLRAFHWTHDDHASWRAPYASRSARELKSASRHPAVTTLHGRNGSRGRAVMTSGVPCSICSRYPARHAPRVRVDNVGVHIVAISQIDARTIFKRAVCFLEFARERRVPTTSERALSVACHPGFRNLVLHVVRQTHGPSSMFRTLESSSACTPAASARREGCQPSYLCSPLSQSG